MAVTRKCIVLTENAVKYIQNLLNTKKIKNFSSAINNVIENKMLDEKFEESKNVYHLQNEEFDVKIVKKEVI